MKNLQPGQVSSYYPLSKEAILYVVSQGGNHGGYYPHQSPMSQGYMHPGMYESYSQGGMVHPQIKQESMIKIEPGMGYQAAGPNDSPPYPNKQHYYAPGALLSSGGHGSGHQQLSALMGLHNNQSMPMYKYGPAGAMHGAMGMSPSPSWGQPPKCFNSEEAMRSMMMMQGEYQNAHSAASENARMHNLAASLKAMAYKGESRGYSESEYMNIGNSGNQATISTTAKNQSPCSSENSNSNSPQLAASSKRQREMSLDAQMESEAPQVEKKKNQGNVETRALPDRKAKRETRGSKTEIKKEKQISTKASAKNNQNQGSSSMEELSSKEEVSPVKKSAAALNSTSSKKKKLPAAKNAPLMEEDDDEGSCDESDGGEQDEAEHARKMQKLNQNQTFVDIRSILKFLSENVSKHNKDLLKEKLQFYKSKGPILGEIYESLMNKYLNSNKTKEEKIKFVLRKSFNFLKDRIRKTTSLSKKELELKFFQSYFSEKAQSSLYFSTGNKKANSKSQKDDKITIKDMIMPFRKKSLNKTMNNNFLKRIFSFDRYAYEFVRFIDDFRIYALKDNEKKLDNTAHRILLLIDKNNEFKGIPYRKFKRMPWLHSWIDDTENIAQKLTEYADPNVLKLHSGKIPSRFLEKKKTGHERSRSF